MDLGDGWKLARHADGSYWRERPRTSRWMGIWLPGLLTFANLYVATGILSAFDSGTLQGIGFVPLLGPFLAAGLREPGPPETSTIAIYAVYGVVEAAGFAMLVGGAVARRTRTERQPILIVPAVLQSGVGLHATGHF